MSTQHQASPSFAWLLAVAAGAGALLTALVGGSIYFVARVPPRKAEPVAEKPDPPIPPRDHLSPAGDRKVAVAEPIDPKPRTPPPAEKKAPAPADPKPTDAPPAGQNLMEALGGLTGAHVYQSYLNIGLLADAWEKDVYAEEDAYKMLDAVARMIEGVDKQLAGLADLEMKPEDQKALKRSRELLALLRTQAKELEAYWKTDEKEHADKFHKARETAWTGIKELLKIDEKKE